MSFYLLVCPDVVRMVATDLLSGIPPREILTNPDLNPILIESVVKDLVRKGIAQFAGE
jgi:hypothetical protein